MQKTVLFSARGQEIINIFDITNNKRITARLCKSSQRLITRLIKEREDYKTMIQDYHNSMEVSEIEYLRSNKKIAIVAGIMIGIWAIGVILILTGVI